MRDGDVVRLFRKHGFDEDERVRRLRALVDMHQGVVFLRRVIVAAGVLAGAVSGIVGVVLLIVQLGEIL